MKDMIHGGGHTHMMCVQNISPAKDLGLDLMDDRRRRRDVATCSCGDGGGITRCHWRMDMAEELGTVGPRSR